MNTVTAADYPHFAVKLQARMTALRSAVAATLSRSRSEHDAQIAGQAHDVQDEAFADLLADSDQAQISHELAEIREIDAARARMQQGTYGQCMDCGQPIERRRLEVYPTAKRCVTCQGRREQPSGSAPGSQP